MKNKKTDVGTLLWATVFKRLDGNGFILLKCMVCNHFVASSVCCCVITTEFARYDEKIEVGNPVVDEVFAASLWNNLMSAQIFFCRYC